MKKTFGTLAIILANLFFVTIYTACSDATNACFTYSPVAITTTTDIVFNADCSEMTSFYTWTFGDGTKDTITNSQTISHKYNLAGTYIVTLNAGRRDKMGFVKKGNPIQSQIITVQ